MLIQPIEQRFLVYFCTALVRELDPAIKGSKIVERFIEKRKQSKLKSTRPTGSPNGSAGRQKAIKTHNALSRFRFSFAASSTERRPCTKIKGRTNSGFAVDLLCFAVSIPQISLRFPEFRATCSGQTGVRNFNPRHED